MDSRLMGLSLRFPKLLVLVLSGLPTLLTTDGCHDDVDTRGIDGNHDIRLVHAR